MAATLTGNTQNTQQKKQTNLPLQDPNNPNQPVQLVSQQNTPAPPSSVPQIQPQQVKPISAPQQNSQIQQVSDQSLIQANQQAQQGFQSPNAQLTSQQTQALLKDPNQGMDFDAYRRNQLSQIDSQQADALEAARQGLVGASGSSLAQNNLMGIALKGIENKANFTNQLDASIANQRSQNLLNALAAGRETTGMELGISEQNLNSLLAARGAAEPELNRQQTSSENAMNRGLELALQSNEINAQKEALSQQLAMDKWKAESGYQFTAQQNALNRTLELTLQSNDLQGNKELAMLKQKLDSGLLTQEQEWKAAQAALDRAAEIALQQGDIAGQLQIQQLRAQIEAAAQESAQKWQTAERIATQAFTSQERLSTQDFQIAQMYLKQSIDQAAAEQDFERQKYLQSQEHQLQLKMQTNDMQYGEKMAYLNMQLQEAQANNDVGRQKEILTFQHGQEMERIRQEQGFEASMQFSQQQFQQAMQKGDFAHAETMLQLQQSFQAEEAMKDRAVEYAQIALQQQGLNFDQEMAQYNAIAQINPEQAQQYLKSMLEGKFDLKITDALESAKQALKADFELQKYQYALTHPESKNPEQDFYAFYNSNMYDEKSGAGLVDQIVQGVFNAQQIRSDPAKLAAAEQAAIQWTPDQYKDKDGRNTYRFKSIPASNTPFTYNGQLLMRISEPKDISDRGTDEQAFIAMDLNTGKTVTFQTHS